MIPRLVCCFILLFSLSFTSRAQAVDSTTVEKKEPKNKTVLFTNHSPTKATIYSTLLPGLGQVYNRKYWKLPIIYGLGGWLVYNISTSHSNYTDFRDALYARQDPDQTEIKYAGIYSDVQLKSRKDFYKRSRDMNVIYALLLYSANILDAVVDAHLINFNVGEQYIMTLEPTFLPTASVSSSIGLSLTVNFK